MNKLLAWRNDLNVLLRKLIQDFGSTDESAPLMPGPGETRRGGEEQQPGFQRISGGLANKRLMLTGRRFVLDDDLSSGERCRCVRQSSRGRPAA